MATAAWWAVAYAGHSKRRVWKKCQKCSNVFVCERGMCDDVGILFYYYTLAAGSDGALCASVCV